MLLIILQFQWQDLIKKFPDGTATINETLCLCPKCKKYFSQPRKVFYVPNEGYHYDFQEPYDDMVSSCILYYHYHPIIKENIFCLDCNTEATVMEKYSYVPCPICGKILRGRDVGNWD